MDQINVWNVDDFNKKVKDEYGSKKTLLVLSQVKGIKFHRLMPVDAKHSGSYCVEIKYLWGMLFRHFIASSINETGPVTECGIRMGDLFLEVV